MLSQRNASCYAAITGSRSSHRWWIVEEGDLKQSQILQKTPVKFVKFLRTPILKNISEQLLLWVICFVKFSRCKAHDIHHACKYKSLVSISSLDGQKNKLLSEWKCPEAVVRRCTVKKLFLNILENFQETPAVKSLFIRVKNSRAFIWIFNDTHRENCVLFNSVQE